MTFHRRLRWRALVASCVVTALVMLASRSTQAADDAWSSGPAVSGGKIVFEVATAGNEDPAAAGKAAAESLKSRMGGVPLRAVLVSECFEDRENKEKLLEGCLLYTSPSPRDGLLSRMPSSA